MTDFLTVRLRYFRAAVAVPSLAILLAFNLFAQAGDPEARWLLEPVKRDGIKLTDAQKTELANIESSPKTASCVLARFARVELPSSDVPLAIELKPDLKFVMTGYKLKTTRESLFISWFGKDLSESASITLLGNNVSGRIHFKDKIFSIVPLGDGLEALVEMKKPQ
jgi:hypothetical protein